MSSMNNLNKLSAFDHVDSEVIYIAVVIPCYRVSRQILEVINGIGGDIHFIYVIDDACPEGTGALVEKNIVDSRVRVLFHKENQGVGGAVMSGYKAAIADGADIIIKLDGDGQMDPAIIPDFIAPIIFGKADYTKGNRFYDLEKVRAMPMMRLLGNAVLSFMNKLSSGYWNIFDPTNGYTAIHADVAKHLPFEKISNRYFFESDLLFRINILRASVVDVPMYAHYADEVSSLRISKIIGEFIVKHLRNFFKRIFYNYYLRDMSLASIELPLGLFLLIFGLGYGIYHWILSSASGIATPAGTVMLSALPILMGMQFIFAFLAYDIASVPRNAIHRRIL